MSNVIFNWFNNLIIRDKIFVVYAPLLIIPLVLIIAVAQFMYTNSITEKTKVRVTDNSNLIINQIESMIQSMENSSTLLSINLNSKDIRDLYLELQELPFVEPTLFQLINWQIAKSLLIFPEVESILFIDNAKRILTPDTRIIKPVWQDVESSIHTTIQNTQGSMVWFPMERRDTLVTDPNIPVLSIGKKIINIQSGKPLGVLIQNIQENALSEVYSNISYSPSSKYLIVNREGTIISSTNKEELLTNLKDQSLIRMISATNPETIIQKLDNTKMIVSITHFPRFDWRLVSMVPVNELIIDSGKFQFVVIILGMVCLIFGLLGALHLSHLIARPIVKLTKEMRRMDVIQKIKPPIKQSHDEIGFLSSGFVQMLNNMQTLFFNIQEEQKQKREMELSLIQAQIKPHFLYNSLETIYAQIGLGRTADAQKMVKAISDFYRYTLSGGEGNISMSKELDLTTVYLDIQKIRYPNVLEYELDIPINMKSLLIPHLTLQPLIENAIYHGLKERKGFGLIRIHGEYDDDYTKIRIMDNGKGINPERLKELRLYLKGAKPSVSSFGLRNVHERIRLNFGELYGLDMESNEGEGTTVTILLPSIRRNT